MFRVLCVNVVRNVVRVACVEFYMGETPNGSRAARSEQRHAKREPNTLGSGRRGAGASEKVTLLACVLFASCTAALNGCFKRHFSPSASPDCSVHAQPARPAPGRDRRSASGFPSASRLLGRRSHLLVVAGT